MAAGLSMGWTGRRQVRRAEFRPGGPSGEIRLVQMIGRARFPVAGLAGVTVVEKVGTPYDESDPEPAAGTGVGVRFRTPRGVRVTPPLPPDALRSVGAQLDALLKPLGRTLERRTEHAPRRRPLIEEERRTWWQLPRVAQEWDVEPLTARVLASFVRVRTSIARGTRSGPVATYYEPYAVRLVAEQIADGTVARHAAWVLLGRLDEAEPDERRAPSAALADLLAGAELADRRRTLQEALRAWRRESEAAANRAPAATTSATEPRMPAALAAQPADVRRALSLSMLGGTVPPGAPSDEVLRRQALAARPSYGCGGSNRPRVVRSCQVSDPRGPGRGRRPPDRRAPLRPGSGRRTAGGP